MESRPTSELIRTKILAKLPAVAAKNNLTITHLDVQAMLIGTAYIWTMITECTGAVIGEEHHLVYSHGFMEEGRHPTPLMPSDRMIENAVNVTCYKLVALRRIQLQAQSPNN